MIDILVTKQLSSDDGDREMSDLNVNDDRGKSDQVNMPGGRERHVDVDGRNIEWMDGPEMTQNLCTMEKSRVRDRDMKPEHCTMRSDNLQQFWSRTDIIVREFIALTKHKQNSNWMEICWMKSEKDGTAC